MEEDHAGEHGHGEHGHGEHGHRHALQGDVLVVRPNSGLSGDMLLAGFARMARADSEDLARRAADLGLPEGCVCLEARAVNSILGWGCRITLPREHAHRTLADVRTVIETSTMGEEARCLALRTFVLLAEAEGRVHGIDPARVTFHEVGALDSILDICLVASLFADMAPARFVCGPLPLCDGTVRCHHGLLPAPAPAVLDMLEGVPVHGIASEGETVTPTAIALLKGLGARFGGWPSMTVRERALVYGTKVLPGVSNGAIFARGPACSDPAD